MTYRKSVGDLGEKIAADFLVRQDYFIETKNYHSRFGEIDIVASKSDCLYFIEVKTRSNQEFGLAEESINFFKKDKLFKTIQDYLSKNEIESEYCFQVIIIYLDFQARRAKIKHYPQVALF
ncbi:MAG: YraN family protein [Patescibacteria group bacterium]